MAKKKMRFVLAFFSILIHALSGQQVTLSDYFPVIPVCGSDSFWDPLLGCTSCPNQTLPSAPGIRKFPIISTNFNYYWAINWFRTVQMPVGKDQHVCLDNFWKND
jgi:hypothetical protein